VGGEVSRALGGARSIFLPVHTTPIRVRFDEVDSMGIVHHPRYVVYFEVARTAWMRDLGLPYSEMLGSGTHLAVLDVDVRHKSPARYDDELGVLTWCTECGRTRITLEYEVRRGDDLLATGRTRLGAVTPAGRATRLPAAFREIVAPHVISRE
jgi:acyl-CoA thioester hydrolase